jgi:hypothetical protein
MQASEFKNWKYEKTLLIITHSISIYILENKEQAFIPENECGKFHIPL